MLKQTSKALILCAVTIASFTNSSASAGDGFWWDLFHHDCDCLQLTASEEILFMGRDSAVESSGSVVNGPDANLLGYSNSDFDHEAGYRFSLGIQSPERRIEAIFGEYGDWAWRDAGNLTTGLSFDGGVGFPAGINQLGNNTFFRPLFLAATAAADETDGLGPSLPVNDPLPTYENAYSSNLQDLQINILDNDGCKTLRIGFGYRNVQLDELARTGIVGGYRAFDIAAADGGLTSADLTGAGLTFLSGVDDGFQDTPQDILALNWNGAANNDLNGLQFIADLALIDGPRFNMTMIGKAGAFHNHASGRVSERYTGTGASTSEYGRSFSGSKDTVSFVGGLALKASWCLTDHLQLITGYEGILVSGVALAPDQAAGIDNGNFQVNTDGNVIVHGTNLGLELTY